MDAAKPFDPSAKADIVLRTSNSVDFFVMGPLLSFVSPIFEDMFSLNRGAAAEQNESKNGLPIVPVPENSETLHLLLSLTYPYAHEPELENTELFSRVCIAAQKYCMETLEEKLLNMILVSELITQEPFRIYVIAVSLGHGWDKVVTIAAQNSLQIPMEELMYTDELRQISAADFYCYMRYRLEWERYKPVRNVHLPFDKPASPTTSRPPAPVDSTSQDQTISRFDSSAEADVILRSCDSVDFYVLRVLLRLVSSAFDAMISLNEKNGNFKDGLVVVPVTEDSSKLRQLLLIIYHYADVPNPSDELYLDVGIVAQKYKMQTLELRLRAKFHTSPLLTEEPLRTYAIAVKFNWEDEAKLVAANTLHRSLYSLAYNEELKRISGADFYHFLKYRFRCVNAVNQIFENIDRETLYRQGRIEYGKTDSWNRTAPSTFPKFLENLQRELKDAPRGVTTVGDESLRKILTETIEFSRSEVETISKVLGSRRVLLTAVEEAVSKVVLDENKSSETADPPSTS
ncbi:hypothetical protein AX17_004173 [Amanita inopinata Kibby_2008]|nr:hypothetical protein AX17_004173 [Amanita inopinata Kibby_2008]